MKRYEIAIFKCSYFEFHIELTNNFAVGLIWDLDDFCIIIGPILFAISKNLIFRGVSK